ncbi:coiled-coil domain-containing protein 9 isoform X4 [Prionailurus iriomotensis]
MEEVTSQPLPPSRVGPASQEPRKLKRKGLRQLQAGTEGQETAEITDFQRVRFCKVVAAAPPPGAAR